MAAAAALPVRSDWAAAPEGQSEEAFPVAEVVREAAAPEALEVVPAWDLAPDPAAAA